MGTITSKYEKSIAKSYTELTLPCHDFNRGVPELKEGVIHNWLPKLVGVIKTQHECIGTLSETDFNEDLEQIDVPQLVMHGEGEAVLDHTTVSIPPGRRSFEVESVSSSAASARDPERLELKEVRHDLRRGWQRLLAMEIAEALDLIASIGHRIVGLGLCAAHPLLVELDVMCAVGLALRDDTMAALPLAEFAVRKGANRATLSIAFAICRLGYWKLGDLASFYAIPRDPFRGRVDGRRASAAAFDRAVEGAVEFEQLRLVSAGRLAAEGLELADRHAGRVSMAIAFPAALSAQILYEQGYIDEAEAIARTRLSSIRRFGPLEGVLRIYLTLARIAVHRGEGEVATLLLREGEKLGENRGWTRLVAACVAERLNLLVDEGHLEEADACLVRLGELADGTRGLAGASRSEVEMHRALSEVRISLARRPTLQALTALKRLHQKALSESDKYAAMRLTVRLVDALLLMGQDEQAIVLLVDATRVGAKTGLNQTFADGGDRIARLLATIYHRALVRDSDLQDLVSYLGSLVSRRKDAAPLFRVQAANGRLTPQERNILGLIGRGLSNKNIAQTLSIAPETVKSHMKHIFVKLAAQTRAEALSRAEGLGLL